ncbi:hypothetical protein OEG86_17340 [Hoeflea alexandrii]|uniref:hypothetical protein n=1 Tax=Hoeflea alexandrii TaxID=288436 RepID=UPI00226E77DE|nr:hypothetical protein [Hoeflea alexandrii]MCY0153697.1 hypothetical protein [Hoeflea alexandrii]
MVQVMIVSSRVLHVLAEVLDCLLPLKRKEAENPPLAVSSCRQSQAALTGTLGVGHVLLQLA